MNQPIEIEVETLADWMKNRDDVILVDCREVSEHDTAKITGSVLIPMSQWAAKAGELDAYKDKQIVVHCHHGGRSMRVTNWLRQNGFPTALNLAGGIHAWSQRIDPSVPQY
ncbi:MAG: rhodanese-like domain-containing protein [Pirellulales bacterium]